MKINIPAKDIMTKEVISVNAGDSLFKAWRILNDHKITGAPVVNDLGNLVGIISQTDLIKDVYSETTNPYPSNSFYYETPYLDGSYWSVNDDSHSTKCVSEVMATNIISSEIDSNISIIASMMRSHKIHRVMITDKGRLVGIISSLDLIKLLEEQC